MEDEDKKPKFPKWVFFDVSDAIINAEVQEARLEILPVLNKYVKLHNDASEVFIEQELMTMKYICRQLEYLINRIAHWENEALNIEREAKSASSSSSTANGFLQRLIESHRPDAVETPQDIDYAYGMYFEVGSEATFEKDTNKKEMLRKAAVCFEYANGVAPFVEFEEGWLYWAEQVVEQMQGLMPEEKRQDVAKKLVEVREVIALRKSTSTEATRLKYCEKVKEAYLVVKAAKQLYQHELYSKRLSGG